jgi:MFS family permease
MSSPRPVLVAQATASLGLAAGGAAGGLLAVAVTGDHAVAAAPLGALVLGAGLSAPPAAAVMSRWGRVPGLVAGYVAGALGAGLVLVAAGLGSLAGLLAGNLLLGAGNTAVMMSRYVVADLSPAHQRGRAISRSLLTITAGAVVGPNLLGPASHIAHLLGLPGPAGLYLVALVAFAVAPALLLVSVRSGGRGPGESPAPVEDGATPAPSREVAGSPGVAIAVLTAANATMVAIMAVSPVHLHAHGHGLGLVGVVVSVHITAMYVASPLLGRLSDRFGPRRLAVVGAVLLTVVGVAPLLTGTSSVAVSALLLLLGVAWNVQVVAGSAMLTATAPLRLRPRLEARGELAMSVGAATAGLVLAGPLAAAGGIELLAAGTVVLNLPLLLVLRGRPWPSRSLRTEEALA